MKYCHSEIEHLVCRKLYSKTFENRFTNKQVLTKTFLKREFLYKNIMEGFMPQKQKSLLFYHYCPKSFKMIRKTLHGEVNIIKKNAFS